MEEAAKKAKLAADKAGDRALANITELIVATLREGTPQRFEEVKKLCDVAQNLVKARVRRVADVVKAEPPGQGNDDNMANYQQAVHRALNAVNIMGGTANNTVTMTTGNAGCWGGAVYAGPYNVVDTPEGGRQAIPVEGPQERRMLFAPDGSLVDQNGIAWTGPLDSNALMRHMIMAFGPHAQTGAEANRARVAADEATELKALTGLVETMPEPERVNLRRRIRNLMVDMEKRADAPKPAQVVHPDDPRGHQVGEGGGHHAPPRLPAHVVGDAGNGEPPRTSVVVTVGTQAVV